MDGDWAVWARVMPAVGMLPLGGPAPRLVLGAGLAALLAEWTSPPAVDAWGLAGEAALGAALGVLAAVPAHAAEALRGDGPEALGFAGRVWTWAIFFGVGGPAMLLLALAASFRALPAAAWPGVEAIVAAGGTLLHAAIVLGLPAWLTGLLAGPLAALVDRLGGAGSALVPVLRPTLALGLLAATLPALLDEMRGDWLSALAAP